MKAMQPYIPIKVLLLLFLPYSSNKSMILTLASSLDYIKRQHSSPTKTAAMHPPTSSRTTRQTQVISPVIAATVIESSPRNTENIMIIFRVTNNTGMVCNINISVKVSTLLSFFHIRTVYGFRISEMCLLGF